MNSSTTGANRSSYVPASRPSANSCCSVVVVTTGAWRLGAVAGAATARTVRSQDVHHPDRPMIVRLTHGGTRVAGRRQQRRPDHPDASLAVPRPPGDEVGAGR